MPFYGTSGKVADASLYYVVGNGEVREKRIPLEERLIDCRDDSIWDIELEPRYEAKRWLSPPSLGGISVLVLGAALTKTGVT